MPLLDPKWKKLLAEKDHSMVWQAINYKGDIESQIVTEKPTGEEFKAYLEAQEHKDVQTIQSFNEEGRTSLYSMIRSLRSK